jgi:hypothetical protein
LNDLLYAGCSQEARDAVSNDAFELPAYRSTGSDTFEIMDKSGKVIATAIGRKMLMERLAQLSKYRGKVPFVTNFIKQFGAIGAYPLDSFLLPAKGRQGPTGMGIDQMLTPSDYPELNNMSEVDKIPGFYKTGFGRSAWKDMAEFKGAMPVIKLEGNDPGETRDALPYPYDTRYSSGDSGFNSSRPRQNMGPTAFGSDSLSGNQNTPLRAFLYALGIRKSSSSEELYWGMAKVTGFTAPTFVIRPFYPTESHVREFEKLIVNGMSMLTYVNGGSPELDVMRKARLMNGYVQDNPARDEPAR